MHFNEIKVKKKKRQKKGGESETKLTRKKPSILLLPHALAILTLILLSLSDTFENKPITTSSS